MDFVRRELESGSPDDGSVLQEPFLIISGAMKAGTTTLFDVLAQHPEICPSNDKEPGFFSFEEVYSRGMDWYRTLWDSPGEGRKVYMEASTHYTKEPEIPSGAYLAERHLADVRFIYVVRNPIKRIESHVNFVRMQGMELRGCEFSNPHVVNLTRYMSQLDPYLERFGKERVMVVDFDDLIRKPERSLRKICEFAGIDPSFSFGGLAHSGKTTRVSRYQQLQRWASYHKIPRLVRGLVRLGCFPLALSKLEMQRMNEETREEILAVLSEDIVRFHDTFGWYPLDDAVVQSLRKAEPVPAEPVT